MTLVGRGTGGTWVDEEGLRRSRIKAMGEPQFTSSWTILGGTSYQLSMTCRDFLYKTDAI